MAEVMKKLVAEKHLRRRAVQEVTGLSRSTIYDLMRRYGQKLVTLDQAAA